MSSLLGVSGGVVNEWEDRVRTLWGVTTGLMTAGPVALPEAQVADLHRAILLLVLGVIGSITGTVIADAIKRWVWRKQDAEDVVEMERVRLEVLDLRHKLEQEWERKREREETKE